MEDYKREFIKFMVHSNVLKFGEFTLKSGRKSPFFMNAGAYVTGEQLHKLGLYYARAIHDNFGLDFDVVFGPAYKGIPLSVITAMGINELYGKQVQYCSNRKEAKDHGADAGMLLGAELKDGQRVVMVEDVTTSGMEVGKGGKVAALQEVSERWGMPTAAIVSMDEVTEALYNNEVNGRIIIDDTLKNSIDAYYQQYGVK